MFSKISAFQFVACMLALGPSLAFAEGSIELGLVQGLEHNSKLNVHLEAGETLKVCSSDNGVQEENVPRDAAGTEMVKIDANPGSSSPSSTEWSDCSVDNCLQNGVFNDYVCSCTGTQCAQACGPRLFFEGRKGAEIVLHPAPGSALYKSCENDNGCSGEFNSCRFVADGLPFNFAKHAAGSKTCMKAFDVSSGRGYCNATTPEPKVWHEFQPTSDGEYVLGFAGEPESRSVISGGSTRYFDVQVFKGNTKQEGRLYSDYWQLNSHYFSESPLQSGSYVPSRISKSYGADSNFYIVANTRGFTSQSGNPAHVFKIEYDNISGFRWQVSANQTGIEGITEQSWCQYGDPDENQLCPPSGTQAKQHTGEYLIYLNEPEVDEPLKPDITIDASQAYLFVDELGTNTISPNGDGNQDEGYFKFTSNIRGSYQIVVDTDGDGVFDTSKDWSKVDKITLPKVNVPWGGVDRDGHPIQNKIYKYRVTLIAGETHFPMADIEENYNGFTISKLGEDGKYHDEKMYWNDEKVRGDAHLVNDDDAVKTVPDGSRVAGDDATQGSQRRYWSQRKNDASKDMPVIFDTWVYGDKIVKEGEIVVDCAGVPGTCLGDELPQFNPEEDIDGDGLPYREEYCAAAYDADGHYSIELARQIQGNQPPYCTDPNEEDTDGDGLPDGVEARIGTNPLEPDSDGDGLPDGEEYCEAAYDANGNYVLTSAVTAYAQEVAAHPDDYHYCTNPANEDTDGDGIPDATEIGCGEFDATTHLCSGPAKDDERGKVNITNPLNADTDGDGIPDGVEDADHDGHWRPGSYEEGGETNPTNADTDGDGMPDGKEDANHNGKVDDGETDPRVADKFDSDASVEDFEAGGSNLVADCAQTGSNPAAWPLFFLPLLAFRRRK